MLKVVNEAIIGDYHFIVGDDYFCVTMLDKELVHLKIDEARELMPWLSKHITPTLSQYPKTTLGPAMTPQKHSSVSSSSTGYLEPDPYVDRKAVVSDKAKEYFDKLGDPFLAARAPMASADGKQAILGVEVTDLGKAAMEAGIPIPRR